MASAGGMPGTICAGGSLAPPSRTTILRGPLLGAVAVCLRRFGVTLAEPTPAEPTEVFSWGGLSGALLSAAGALFGGACSAESGGAGVCPAEFGSCCTQAIPVIVKLSQSAILSPQASRISVPTGL